MSKVYVRGNRRSIGGPPFWPSIRGGTWTFLACGQNWQGNFFTASHYTWQNTFFTCFSPLCVSVKPSYRRGTTFNFRGCGGTRVFLDKPHLRGKNLLGAFGWRSPPAPHPPDVNSRRSLMRSDIKVIIKWYFLWKLRFMLQMKTASIPLNLQPLVPEAITWSSIKSYMILCESSYFLLLMTYSWNFQLMSEFLVDIYRIQEKELMESDITENMDLGGWVWYPSFWFSLRVLL